MGHVKRKVLGLWIAGTVLAVCLAGCGIGTAHSSEGEGSGQGDSTVQADTSTGEQSQKGVRDELTISSFNNLIKEEFISAFHEVYPEVNLRVVSYAGINGSAYAMHSLENGDIPDIYVTSQNFSREAQEKYLIDLSNYGFVNHYSNALLDSLDINGCIYLLPSGYQLTGIYYNKTILEENGWEPPRSFKELEELSEKLETAGYRTMGHGMVLDGFPFNYFFNIGNTVYFGTPEGTEWKEAFPAGKARAAGNSGLREAAEYFNKWVEHGFITSQHMETDDFYEGKCVFFLCLGLSEYEHTAQNGKTYEFGTIPWLSEDGSNNMLTRTVSRYMGIHNTLAEPGNEQKLEDALKLLDYVSSEEGQRALMSSSSQYMPSLNEATLAQDSPYNEIADLVNEGRTVPLLYVGWEQLVVPIAQDVKLLIEGRTDVDGMIAAFDETNDGILSGTSDDVYGTVEETLSLEKTAELVAVAEGEAAGADCAMVSLNEYHGNDMSNRQGVAWRLYQGKVNFDVINMIRPRADTVSVLEMTGAEIKAMRDAGADLDGNGNPYEYLLFTKGDIELEDGTVYRLAISTGELTGDMLAKATETEISPFDAIKSYLAGIGTVSGEVIRWE